MTNNNNQITQVSNQLNTALNNIAKAIRGQDKIDEIEELKRENKELHEFLFKVYQNNEVDRKKLKKILFKDINSKFI
ncbi:hypothetical protein CPT_Machias_096 [Staphylococcus phage Machias]|nr:hypothetical protein CPT_Machias_096 [Staphylococcus phage Machias]